MFGDSGRASNNVPSLNPVIPLIFTFESVINVPEKRVQNTVTGNLKFKSALRIELKESKRPGKEIRFKILSQEIEYSALKELQ